MTLERWQDLVATILDRFAVSDRGQQALEEGPGTREYIEFASPAGDIRLEFTTRPVVIGKKTFGGRKVGTATGVKYEYSQTETSHQFSAWRKVDGQWQEVDPQTFASV